MDATNRVRMPFDNVKFGVVFVVLLSALTCPVLGQRFGRNTTKRESELTQPSREVLSLFKEAEDYIEKEQWNSAIVSLSALLGLSDQPSDEVAVDYFLPSARIEKGDSLGNSLFQRIYEILDKLPDDARKTLQVKFGLEAEQQLANAIQSSDWAAVEAISAKYRFMPSGWDATLLLADRAMHQGESSRAASLYLSLLQQSQAVDVLGPKLVMSAIDSLVSVGDLVSAEKVLQDTKGRVPPFQLNWNGIAIEWKGNADSKSIVQSIKATQPTLEERLISRPLTLGGNAKRNANTNAGVLLPYRRWHAELHESEFRKQALATAYKEQLEASDRNSYLIPSRSAISVGRVVIVPTYDHRIHAFDALTGLFLWECPYTGMPVGFSPDRIMSRMQFNDDPSAPDYLVKRVWAECSLGQISSDGDRIYGLSEMPSIDIAEAHALGPTARIGRPNSMRHSSVLQCWSVPAEGKLLWEVGGSKSVSEPLLTNTLFLGPPQPSRNELLILGEQNGDVILFSLQPESGKLLWRQPLVSNVTGTIIDDMLLRVAGATPTVDGDIVLCPTLSGHYVAFDRHRKSLLWARPYETREGHLAQAGAFGTVQAVDYSPFLSRSADLAPVAAHGISVYAPIDGTEIFAVSTFTGTSLWEASQSREGGLRYIAGIHDNCVICVCQSEVYGLDLRTGKELWKTGRLPDGAQVIGRSVRRNHLLYVPTSNQTILEIDTKTGKVTASTEHEEPLGNLIFASNRILATSPFQLTCYEVKSLAQDALKMELAQDSVSVSSLVKRGEFALSEKRIDEALGFLEQAYKTEPDNPESWGPLKKAISAALSIDFEKYIDRASQFKIQLDDDFGYVSLLVQKLESKQRHDEVVLKVLELADQFNQRKGALLAGKQLMQLSPEWSIRQDHWVASKMEKAIPRLGEIPPQSEVAKAIANQRNKLDRLTPSVLKLRLKQLRGLTQFHEVRKNLAEEFLADRHYLEAEDVLVEPVSFGELDELPAIDKESSFLLAKVYASTGRDNLAMRLLEKGSPERIEEFVAWRDDVLRRSALRIGQLSYSNRPFPPEPVGEWSTGKVVAETLRSEQYSGRSSPSQCRINKRIGEAMQGWDMRWTEPNKHISLFDPVSKLTWIIRLESMGWDRNAPNLYCIDGRLIIENNRTIVAVDGLQESENYGEPTELWHTAFNPPPQVTRGRTSITDYLTFLGTKVCERTFRVVSASRRGLVVFENDHLECLDINSGEVLWKRSGLNGCIFSEDGAMLHVLRPGKELFRIDVRDGELVDSKAFRDSGNEFFPLGRYMLMAEPQKGQFKLVDLRDAKVLLERTFSADTVVGVDRDTGLVALDNAGQLTYWNVSEAKEYLSKISIDAQALEYKPADRIDQRLSIARHKDKIIVMPFHSGLRNLELQIYPGPNEDSFSQVSGSVFAISAKDGTPVWEKPVPMMQYAYPLHQDKTSSPAIIFTRRIDLPRVNNNEFASIASLAVLDVDTGHLLYRTDDVPGFPRQSAFTQTIFQDEDRMFVGFGGVQFQLSWTDEPRDEKQPEAIGVLDATEYKDRIKEMFQNLRTNPNLNQPLLTPPPSAFPR